MHLDTLSGFDTIRICMAYRHGGRLLETFPAESGILNEVEPVYDTVPGWSEDLSAARRFDELPPAAVGYVEKLEQAAGARVATVFPNITRRYFSSIGRDVTLVPISGAAEIAPHLGVADIIVDLVSTGSTLKVNGLVEVETVLTSTAQLIARVDLLEDPENERRARELTAALSSVLRAQEQRYLMANVPRAALGSVKDVLPGLNGPTVVDILNGGDHVAVHAVVGAGDIYRTIARLQSLGATGLLVTRIERLVP